MLLAIQVLATINDKVKAQPSSSVHLPLEAEVGPYPFFLANCLRRTEGADDGEDGNFLQPVSGINNDTRFLLQFKAWAFCQDNLQLSLKFI